MSDLNDINIRETSNNPFEVSDANSNQNRPKSAIASLQDQIGEAKNVMVSNIGKILERGENLDNLQARTDDLQATVSLIKPENWPTCGLFEYI